jgi:restriction system protein
VAQLFRKKGYKVALRGGSGDKGVDLELQQAGGRRAIVQCKRYRRPVGPEVVRELFGTLVHERVSHAFLVTTADISNSARDWAQGKPMTLIDGNLLAQVSDKLMDVE